MILHSLLVLLTAVAGPGLAAATTSDASSLGRDSVAPSLRVSTSPRADALQLTPGLSRHLYGYFWGGWGAFVCGNATLNWFHEHGTDRPRNDRWVMAAASLGAAAGWSAVLTGTAGEYGDRPSWRSVGASVAGSAVGYAAWWGLDRATAGRRDARDRAMAVGGFLSVLLSGWLGSTLVR